jgi:hypothetical protein
VSANPTETESISAADFAEMLRVGGTDLRKLRMTAPPSSAAYDPKASRLRRPVEGRPGSAQAVPCGARVGMAVSLRHVADFCPIVRHADGSVAVSHWTPAEARLLAAQLLWAADVCQGRAER